MNGISSYNSSSRMQQNFQFTHRALSARIAFTDDWILRSSPRVVGKSADNLNSRRLHDLITIGILARYQYHVLTLVLGFSHLGDPARMIFAVNAYILNVSCKCRAAYVRSFSLVDPESAFDPVYVRA